jgi:hypothetical protein
MYSVVTLIELAQITDQKQIEAIKEVMENFDYGFSDAKPSRVIQREEESETQGGGAFYSINLCRDDKLIENYFRNIMDPLIPFTMSHILKKMRELRTNRPYREMGNVFSRRLTADLQKARQDPEVLEKAKKRHSRRELQRKKPPYTKDIYSLALDFAVVNESMRMTPNEWRDFLHTVVPVAYCDFVLLDKRWCHFIREVFPLKYPDIAHVYSQRDLEKFLTALLDFKENKANPI